MWYACVASLKAIDKKLSERTGKNYDVDGKA